MIKITIAGAIALAFVSTASAQSIVTNGSFETGDFSGWTQHGTAFTGVVNGPFVYVSPTDGDFQAFFGAIGSQTSLSQQLAVDPGRLYTVSFDLDDFSDGATQEFSASFGGQTLVSYASRPFGSYTHLSFTAVGGDGALVFSARNDPSAWLLDNVQVLAAVPETPMTPMFLTGIALLGLAGARRRVSL